MPARVLVVDDEIQLLRNLEILLKDSGFDVSTASGVAEAERTLAETSFDVLVTDLRMPDGGGAALLKLARERRPAVRAIVMTAYDDLAADTESERGAARLLMKPFDVAELVRLIRDA